MILKDGESLVHLKIRMKKEMSELSAKEAKSYAEDAAKDIYILAKNYVIDVAKARELIESIYPEFYTEPNKLMKEIHNKMFWECIKLSLLFGIIVWAIFFI